ncbi:MAG: transposase [Clostridia bacterium]
MTVYECANCKECPVKEKCIRQREVIEQKISIEEGILLRVNRSIQSEGVFAMIKEDMNFRRFLIRGIPMSWLDGI